MIKIENVVLPSCEQMEAVIRGMRNPMNSWEKSDSYYTHIEDADTLNTAPFEFFVCDADMKLMKNLAGAGKDHRKYLRMMPVYIDITAPLYWWKEFDTYKVGTVANSCSTMHKLVEKEFSIDDFSHEHLISIARDRLHDLIRALNYYRETYLHWSVKPPVIQEAFDYDKKEVWYQMIQLLPSSYNQRRTVMLNYEVLATMYFSRRDHKLDEWREFCKWVEELPYFKDIFEVQS